MKVTPADSGPATRFALVVFQVRDRQCAIRADEVLEILPMAELSRPPGLPSIMAGFLNLAGTAVAVLRLARLLELEDVPLGLYTPLIVLRGQAHPAGLIVDGVLDVINVAADDEFPLGEQRIAGSAVRWKNRLVAVVSTERILLEQERACVAELQAREQQRLREIEGDDVDARAA